MPSAGPTCAPGFNTVVSGGAPRRTRRTEAAKPARHDGMSGRDADARRRAARFADRRRETRDPAVWSARTDKKRAGETPALRGTSGRSPVGGVVHDLAIDDRHHRADLPDGFVGDLSPAEIVGVEDHDVAELALFH